eukprot:365028-Chlamydomonas_euryale.AAC.36
MRISSGRRDTHEPVGTTTTATLLLVELIPLPSRPRGRALQEVREFRSGRGPAAPLPGTARRTRPRAPARTADMSRARSALVTSAAPAHSQARPAAHSQARARLRRIPAAA